MADIEPASDKNCESIRRRITSRNHGRGLFLSLKLLKAGDVVLSENFYWLPDSTGNYPFLQQLQTISIEAMAENPENGRIDLKRTNDDKNPVAFFIRISLGNGTDRERILPVL